MKKDTMKIIESNTIKASYKAIIKTAMALYSLLILSVCVLSDPGFLYLLLPIWAFTILFIALSLPDCFASYKYDGEKFIKKRFLINRTVYYKDISHYKNELCFSVSKWGNIFFFRQGFFTLKNGRKVEFNIHCEKKELNRLLASIKRANPCFKVIEEKN